MLHAWNQKMVKWSILGDFLLYRWHGIVLAGIELPNYQLIRYTCEYTTFEIEASSYVTLLF